MDLSVILDDPRENSILSEVVMISYYPNTISVTVLGTSIKETEEWNAKISNVIMENENVVKDSTVSEFGFNQDVLTRQIENDKLISEMNSSLLKLEEDALDNKEPPTSISYLKFGLIGIILGLVISFIAFSAIPVFSGLICTSKEIEDNVAAPCIGTMIIRKTGWISKKILKDRAFKSRMDEIEYISSSIKRLIGEKKELAFLSTGKILDEKILVEISKACNVGYSIYDKTLINTDFMKNIPNDSMIIDVESAFICSKYRLFDLKSNLKSIGLAVDACICFI